MAAKNFYIKDARASNSNHGSLADGVDQGGVATSTGWGTFAGTHQYATFVYNSVTSAWVNPPQPATNPSAGNNSFRSEVPYLGTFAAGNWTINLKFSVPGGVFTTWDVWYRIWKSVNEDGSSPTEITSGISPVATSLFLNFTPLVPAKDVHDTLALGAVTLTNEYLFIQVALQQDTNGVQAVTLLTGASSGATSVITTTNFTGGVVYFRSIGDSFGCSDNGPVSEDRAESGTTSAIFLDSVTKSWWHPATISDSITFVHQASSTARALLTSLAFSHAASASGTIFSRSVFDGLQFFHSFTRVILLLVTDSLTLSTSGIRGPSPEVDDICSFNDSGVGQRVVHPADVDHLTFIDSATRAAIIHSRTLTDAVLFSDYSNRNTSLVPCDTYSTALGVATAVVISYPVISPSSSVSLRLPEFGNKRAYSVSAKVKRTLDAFPRVTRKSTWPKIEIFHFTFTSLTVAQREAFLAFIDLTAGLNIRLLDQDNVNWQGVITDPTSMTSQEGPGCQYKVQFTFRGTKL